MAKKHVLVVDDEEDILELIRFNLEKAQYICTCVTTGIQAIRAAKSSLPDIVLLDLMLPELSGYEVCSKLKSEEQTRHIPIIMVTAKGSDADVVRGLESGADDYIIKPFSPRVLIARVGAVLRRVPRTPGTEPTLIYAGDLLIHSGRHEVTIDDEIIELTPSEFALLTFLSHRPDWVFTRTQILDALRGVGYPVTDRAVDVVVVGLRKKLGRRGSYIQTVRGIGYRFKE